MGEPCKHNHPEYEGQMVSSCALCLAEQLAESERRMKLAEQLYDELINKLARRT